MTGEPPPAHGVPFVKGHGTGNDFVILSGLDDDMDLTPPRVAAVCDRRRGIGGDGVLLVARTAGHPEVASQSGTAAFFMDYRNADGTVAEMCGNGARVFVAHLVEEGLVEPGAVRIATRGGSREVRVEGDGSYRVDMGAARFPAIDGLTVRPAEAGAPLPGVAVLMPNPHAVTWIQDVADAGPLLQPPSVHPVDAFPDGVNVEFVQVVDPRHLVLRVFERGVGETLSCGTGACAAAVATLRRLGEGPAGQAVRVDVPGGSLEVIWRPDGEVQLRGPAVLVARGQLDRRWWASHG